MKYNEKILMLLKTRGIPPKKFEKDAGISHQTFHNLKHGIGEPYSSTKQKVAKFFGLTIEQLFNDAVPLPAPGGAASVSENQIQRLRDEIARLEAQIVELKSDRDHWRAHANKLLAPGFTPPPAISAAPTTRPRSTEKKPLARP